MSSGGSESARTTYVLVDGENIDATLGACGDYVEGPYPATLEGAVRSGLTAARRISGTERQKNFISVT